jgi:hypothetical protein
MTSKKLFIHLLFAFLFCGSMSVFAQSNGDLNRNTGNAADTAFVNGLLSKLKADIIITVEQEQEISILLAKLYNDRKLSAMKAENAQKLNSKKLDYKNFVDACNAILTEEQRDELMLKAEERRQNRINQYDGQPITND